MDKRQNDGHPALDYPVVDRDFLTCCLEFPLLFVHLRQFWGVFRRLADGGFQSPYPADDRDFGSGADTVDQKSPVGGHRSDKP